LIVAEIGRRSYRRGLLFDLIPAFFGGGFEVSRSSERVAEITEYL
jgi:hypothetical protein